MTIKTAFYTFKQGNNMSLQRYYELFLGQVTVLDEVGISIFDESTAESIARENNRAKPNVKDYAEARERALAIRFLQGANPSRSVEYISHLRNSHLEGNDLYPKTLTEAYHTLSCREPSRGGSATLEGGEGVLFVNHGHSNDQKKKNIKCFNCGVKGHYANQCDKPAS